MYMYVYTNIKYTCSVQSADLKIHRMSVNLNVTYHYDNSNE